ncbi:MAG: hypothetical protein ACYS8K_06405 [Planctomycetota bacterium]|jgi:hypothetical protein
MAENEELTQQVTQLVERAEGYLGDAEFRDEVETRFLRYLQAISDLLIAGTIQNRMIIELLSRQQELDSLSGA